MMEDLCVEVPASALTPAPTAAPAAVETVFRIRWATSRWEADEAMRLRRAVFCVEQGIFDSDDRDEIDEMAQLLVAVKSETGKADVVVGTVRIHESEPGVWYGSRLAVDTAFRNQGKIGATLIRLAVSSAHAMGCRRFLAHVQSQNEPLFRRLHWQSLGEETLLGRPHHRMEADLAYYPPCTTPHVGFTAPGRSAA
ncbi:MSMEG_0567/Sll0786 family nitrogen starvation N-acetyltransferase [Cupriavidus plantarum]|uniref:MSMEG_0567/Sll0786 family nitrogen starvation N-acetyltransferase n=1 Tax=Cupriavidus plantarum TaxID=942865 RepID=UPI0015CC82A5|nr:MSMEG_0567/Sll0786 family nitrogen starvation N-acetyltransferase [Cupriavidus plantarum]NYI01917.1 putative N-acetyltransferase (TIGR04045 family) [Cupriavidus plantarum]